MNVELEREAAIARVVPNNAPLTQDEFLTRRPQERPRGLRTRRAQDPHIEENNPNNPSCPQEKQPGRTMEVHVERENPLSPVLFNTKEAKEVREKDPQTILPEDENFEGYVLIAAEMLRLASTFGVELVTVLKVLQSNLEILEVIHDFELGRKSLFCEKLFCQQEAFLILGTFGLEPSKKSSDLSRLPLVFLCLERTNRFEMSALFPVYGIFGFLASLASTDASSNPSLLLLPTAITNDGLAPDGNSIGPSIDKSGPFLYNIL
uniref:Uncharacterized protein n=1 Tax=Cannabis sativa TaxID=3483 RepID=A0A803PEI6_CANSA